MKIDAHFLNEPKGQHQVQAEGATRQNFVKRREVPRSAGRLWKAFAGELMPGGSPNDRVLRDVRSSGQVRDADCREWGCPEAVSGE